MHCALNCPSGGDGWPYSPTGRCQPLFFHRRPGSAFSKTSRAGGVRLWDIKRARWRGVFSRRAWSNTVRWARLGVCVRVYSGMAKKGKGKSQSPVVEQQQQQQRDKKGRKGAAATDSADAGKSKQQAYREKVTSTASWTGKLPHTLLHETCQKRKWGKVEYDVKRVADNAMVAVAKLSCTDPKSKETLVVRMTDPTFDKVKHVGTAVKPQETVAEARHVAATVALYRIAFNTNLHMMLPPNHKTIWYALDNYRKELLQTDRKRADRLFDVDPFKTMLEDRKLQEQKLKETQAKSQQAEKLHRVPVIVSLDTKEPKRRIAKLESTAHAVKFPRKVWDNSSFIDLSESSRKMLERSLKIYINWNQRKISDGRLPDHALEARLHSLNFRSFHIKEAMEYKDPLSFLLFNLPEDDLPPFFHKRQQDSKNQIEISSLPLAVAHMLERLLECGVSREEALFALKSVDFDENEAAGVLTRNVLPQYETPEDKAITEDESIEIWNQELESIVSVFDESVDIIKPNSCYCITIDAKLKLKVKLYRTKNYPHGIPGIIVSTFDKNYKLPDYIKQQILQRLLAYLYTNNLIGDMIVYSIFEWLRDNIKDIIKNPGPLLTKEEVELSLNHNKNLDTMDTSQTRTQSKHRTHPNRENCVRNKQYLKEMYLERLNNKEYQDRLIQRKELPAWAKRDTIVKLVKENDVVLITGETGSGKSTQIVQFLLDHLQSAEDDFTKTNIICTQPRRISAIGLAERVAYERYVECGDEVGYIIRGVNKTSMQTRIKFMTTGVLVRILQNDKTFLRDSIVIIDEVHERSVETDLLVILLKNLLGKIKGLKLVLMSATVNLGVFKNFFNNLSTCHIEGRTFPIKDYFLDDILKSLDFKIKKEKHSSYNDENDDLSTTEDTQYLRPSADSNFFRSGRINYDLLSKVVVHVHNWLDELGNDGSIIVFLPGIAEIDRAYKMLQDQDSDKNLVVLPLHSALTPEDQRRVFKKYKDARKVVVSTNIAETSITIDDCVATIDTGRAKSTCYSPADNTTRLVESFISKAEAKQRRGRAGRVTDGFSFKLYSKRLYEEDMASMPLPEIKRVALESLYLSVKAMGIKDVKQFLAHGLDPPPAASLAKAERMLATVGLLDDYDNSLTELGRFISLMPVVDSKHGKLLLYSILFACTDIGVLIASVLSANSMPFIGGVENRDRIKSTLAKHGAHGDLLAVVDIVAQYVRLKDSAQKRVFMKENLLSYNKLNDILSSRAQYYSILKDIGFLPIGYKTDVDNEFNTNGKNFEVIIAVMTGALYPQVACVEYPNPKYLATRSGSIEMDPEAKQIKYWIRNEKFIDDTDTSKTVSEVDELPATRAFIHPSSILFSSSTMSTEEIKTLLEDDDKDIVSTKYNGSNKGRSKYDFILFTSANVTSKLFLRDLTPTSTLSLLLFGGTIEYDVSGTEHSPGIVVDSWLPVRTWCKNGVLIKELRKILDTAIKDKLEYPYYSQQSKTNKNLERADSILDLVIKLITMEKR